MFLLNNIRTIVTSNAGINGNQTNLLIKKYRKLFKYFHADSAKGRSPNYNLFDE